MDNILAYLHSTIMCRAIEMDPEETVRLCKRVFERWEDQLGSGGKRPCRTNEAFNVAPGSSSSGGGGVSSLLGGGSSLTGSSCSGLSGGSLRERASAAAATASSSGSFSEPKKESPPTAALFRLLLLTGSVVPGTVRCLAQIFRRQDSAPKSLEKVDETQHNLLATGKLRENDSLSAQAYIEWWQWVNGILQRQREQAQTKQRKDQEKLMKLSRISSSQSNPSQQQQQQQQTSSPVLCCDSKYLLATIFKIGTLLFFVKPQALQDQIGVPHLDSELSERMQHTILSALIRMPSAVMALPHPFLLAHLPGLSGATGQAYIQSKQKRSKSSAASTHQQDLLSFNVQRTVQTPGFVTVNSSDDTTTQRRNDAGDVALEIKFLDRAEASMEGQQQQQDADGATSAGVDAGENQDEDLQSAGGLRRDRADDSSAMTAATSAASNTTSVRSTRAPLPRCEKPFLWTPRTYGCVRFLRMPLRAAATPSATGLIHAMTSCVKHDPPAGVLHQCCYEEPFVVRFIVLCAQRLLRTVATDAPAINKENGKLVSTLRLCCRLCFWAATVSASFPLENPNKDTKRARSTKKNNKKAGTFSGNSTVMSSLNLDPAAANNSSAKSKSSKALAAAQERLMDVLGFDEPFNELVLLPCKAAVVAMHCAQRRAGEIEAMKMATEGAASSTCAGTDGDTTEIPPTNDDGSSAATGAAAAAAEPTSPAAEALLSVTVAYARCTEQQMKDSLPDGNKKMSVEHIIRTTLVAECCKWVRCYPAEQFRAELSGAAAEAVLMCIPEEISWFVKWKLTGKMPTVRKLNVDGTRNSCSTGNIGNTTTWFSFDKARKMQAAKKAAAAAAGAIERQDDDGEDNDDFVDSAPKRQRELREISDRLDAFDHQMMLLYAALERAANEPL